MLDKTVETALRTAGLEPSEEQRRAFDLGASVCLVCGRPFFPTAEWAYRRLFRIRPRGGSVERMLLPVCSWGCFRAQRGLVPMAEKRW